MEIFKTFRGLLPVLLCAVLAVPASAQTLQLSASVTRLARLASDTPTASLSFAIDGGARTLLVDIGSTLPNLVTQLELPGGVVVTEVNAVAIGGTFTKAAGSSTGLGVYPFSGAGTHFVYRVPVSVAGTLTVRFNTPVPPTRDEAVAVQVSSDSPIGTRLYFTDPAVVVGAPAVLNALVFNGGNAVAGAVVQVSLMTGGSIKQTLTLRDDGLAADTLAGDGVYSAVFVPPSLGRFVAVADITGTSGGQAFERQSAASIDVVAATATLADTVRGRGIDLNANGALDRIAVDTNVQVATAGRFRLFVRLGAAGRSLVASGDANLTAGARTLSAEFDTQKLVAAGLGRGPYAVELAELVFLAPGKVQPADRKVNLGIIDLSNTPFERPALQLTGGASDAGLDANANGLFDELRVSLQVDVLSGGTYSFSGRLADDFGTPIALYASSAALQSGLNTLLLRFPGAAIGARGISGPYTLDNLLITDNGARSLNAPGRVARTQTYSYKQFEGAQRQLADLNDDGRVDCADVAIVRAAFGKRRGQAGFDARADLNNDGVVSVVDLGAVTRALPIGLTCS